MPPSWYARVFCGYGAASNRTDNALQTIRQRHSAAKVLVAAVGPYSPNEPSPPPPPPPPPSTLNAPWLNYLDDMCERIGEAM